jgi:phosphoribosylformylglycinamidine cyclo-ligase
MTDYIAVGKVVPERVAAIVDGIARACEIAGTALIGGETAEHPGLLGPDEYDLAGAATGVVDESDLLGPHRVEPGDVIVALGSSGLHSNGYSLARNVFFTNAGWDVHRNVAALGRTLGEELLEPTRIYARDCLALANEVDVHAMAHITGGGLAANVARALPEHLDALLDRSTWRPQPIFDLIGELGAIPPDELERTFNIGVGMVVMLPPADADRAIRQLADRTVPAWVIGSAEPGTGKARLVSSHSS